MASVTGWGDGGQRRGWLGGELNRWEKIEMGGSGEYGSDEGCWREEGMLGEVLRWRGLCLDKGKATGRDGKGAVKFAGKEVL